MKITTKTLLQGVTDDLRLRETNLEIVKSSRDLFRRARVPGRAGVLREPKS